jgi:hypothetical protein
MAMRRPAHAWLTVAVSLSIFAVLLSGCGARSSATRSSAAPGGTGPSALTISPSVGSARSVIRFRFTAPASTGLRNRTQISYSLSVLGPRRSGCVGRHSAVLPAARAGAAVTAGVGPAQLGGRWCSGTFTARVEELVRPVCTPGTMCPQFIRVASVIGPKKFRIAG